MTDFVVPAVLTLEGIRKIVNDFASAAQRAMDVGFDGIELHAAYGYLVHQFLGTNTNLRIDDYGGSDERRAKFLFETIDAIAAVTGRQRLGVRMSPAVPLHDMEDADAVNFYTYIAGELNKKELAYLHIAMPDPEIKETDWHTVLRKVYKGFYIANGGFTRESGARALAEGRADAIAYGKPFIANPDLPERFEKDAPLNMPDPATFYTPGDKGYTDYPSMKVLASL